MTDPDDQGDREKIAAATMASALPPLRRLAADMREAFGDPPEARIADAMILMLAELLGSIAEPGSHEMLAAQAALENLRGATTEDDTHV